MVEELRGSSQEAAVAEAVQPTALIIEDQAYVAEVISDMLSEVGFRTEICLESPRGVDRAVSGSFDLVTTDLQMPGLSGTEVVRKIREHRPDLPIFVISAYADSSSVAELARLSVTDVIPKPFSLNRLEKALEGVPCAR